MAADTRRLAKRSGDPAVAAAYLELAKHWDRMTQSAACAMQSANDDAEAADLGKATDAAD